MLDQVQPAPRNEAHLPGLPARHGMHDQPRRRPVPALTVRGNHYTGRPLDVVLDDVESYRWPTESIAAKLEDELPEVTFEVRLRVPGYVSGLARCGTKRTAS
ncbi:MAG: hypothetical protein HOQ21_09865 [Dermatophilaceae bacterium]|nr:hypothetical protein [Dermatophilaceae bacterium]